MCSIVLLRRVNSKFEAVLIILAYYKLYQILIALIKTLLGTMPERM